MRYYYELSQKRHNFEANMIIYNLIENRKKSGCNVKYRQNLKPTNN